MVTDRSWTRVWQVTPSVSAALEKRRRKMVVRETMHTGLYPHRPFIGANGPDDLAHGDAPSRWIKAEEVIVVPGHARFDASESPHAALFEPLAVPLLLAMQGVDDAEADLIADGGGDDLFLGSKRIAATLLEPDITEHPLLVLER